MLKLDKTKPQQVGSYLKLRWACHSSAPACKWFLTKKQGYQGFWVIKLSRFCMIIIIKFTNITYNMFRCSWIYNETVGVIQQEKVYKPD